MKLFGKQQLSGEDDFFIMPNDSNTVSLVPGASLTGFGLVDGKLHIQVKYDDVLNTDNHGRVYLKDSDGNEINCENSIDFWAENHTDSFQEYVFPASENNQYDYEIWGEFWIS